jgi:hypothetical protein
MRRILASTLALLGSLAFTASAWRRRSITAATVHRLNPRSTIMRTCAPDLERDTGCDASLRYSPRTTFPANTRFVRLARHGRRSTVSQGNPIRLRPWQWQSRQKAVETSRAAYFDWVAGGLIPFLRTVSPYTQLGLRRWVPCDALLFRRQRRTENRAQTARRCVNREASQTYVQLGAAVCPPR